MGYDQTSEDLSDSDVDSYEEIEKMYDDVERRKRKVERIKDEIAKLYKSKKVFVFNVYNVCDKEAFDKKMESEFDYLEYKVTEVDQENDCLAVEVERTMAEDFLNIEGCLISNANISLYLDEDSKGKGPGKTGKWDDAPKSPKSPTGGAVGTWDNAPPKKKPTQSKPQGQKKGRQRLRKN